MTGPADHDVRGLDVAVGEFALVSGGEAFGDLHDDGERHVQWQRSGLQSLSECLAVDEFQRDEGSPLELAGFINFADIWVVDRGRRFRFPEESRANIRPLLCFGGKEFQSHFSIQDCVFSEENFSQAAFPDFLLNSIMRNNVAAQH